MIREGFCFDDVLLVPKYSDIRSRSEVDISVKWGALNFKHPIIPANMKTITGVEMVHTVIKSGGLAILHRFMSIEDQINIAEDVIDIFGAHNFAASVGVKPIDKENVAKFIDVGVKIFCIDVAHGDSAQCAEMTNWIKEKYPNDSFVISGNVATGEGARLLWQAGANVVKVGVGPGCFGAGTRVLMSNGFYKNIEDIKKGDYVINKDGKPVKVLDAFSTGIRKVAKLKNNSFYTDTYVTPDHQFWIGDLSTTSKSTLQSTGYIKTLDRKSKTIPKQSKYKWRPISEAQNDTLLFPRNIKLQLPETFEIHLNKRTSGNNKSNIIYEKDSTIIPNYDSGYLFGTFLGDGHAMCAENNGSHIGSVRWYYGKNELDIAEKTAQCIKNIFNKDPVIQHNEKTIDVIFYYKPLADYLFNFGKKIDKHLPENLLVNNKDYLLGLYDGLLDSDGHYAKDSRNSITNTSIRVIELFNIVNFILNGYLPNNLFRGKNIGGLKRCNSDNLHDSFLSRTLKRSERRLTSDYYVIKNLGYEELDLEMPVYDITVDCDTHSFIANNMIVHNSLCTTRIETGNGTPQLTALMDVARVQKDFMELNKTRDSKSNTHRQYPFIADGGLKNSGDICKALCFADMVMVGNIFAGCEETPGKIITLNGMSYKEYVGSSTHKTNHIEGVSAMVPYKGKFNDILVKLTEGLRSGCSYQGVSNLVDLKKNPEFIKISSAGLRESHPHDVIIK